MKVSTAGAFSSNVPCIHSTMRWTWRWTIGDLWPLHFPPHLQTLPRPHAPITYRRRCPDSRQRSLCWRRAGGALDRSAGSGRSPPSDSLQGSRGGRNTSTPQSFTAETQEDWKGSRSTRHSVIHTEIRNTVNVEFAFFNTTCGREKSFLSDTTAAIKHVFLNTHLVSSIIKLITCF